MSTLTIKNISRHLHRELKQSAVENHRSLNGEVIARLEQALHRVVTDADAWLTKIRTVRKAAGGEYLTDKELLKAKTEGRP